MIENLKLWINSLLCIGIFSLFIKLILPKNSISKYINSIIGIVIIITIISPLTKLFKIDNIENSLNNVIDNIKVEDAYTNYDKYLGLTEEMTKEEAISKIKEDIKTKLKENGVEVDSIRISIDEEYQIQEISLKIKEYSILYSDDTAISNYIKDKYGINIDKIKVGGK